MEPEDFDRKIRLERDTVIGQDEYGADIKERVLLGDIWAKYQPVSDGEKLAGGEVSATLSARFTIRYDSAWADVSAKDILTFEGEEFDVWGAKEVEGRRQFIEITAASRSETPA